MALTAHELLQVLEGRQITGRIRVRGGDGTEIECDLPRSFAQAEAPPEAKPAPAKPRLSDDEELFGIRVGLPKENP